MATNNGRPCDWAAGSNVGGVDTILAETLENGVRIVPHHEPSAWLAAKLRECLARLRTEGSPAGHIPIGPANDRVLMLPANPDRDLSSWDLGSCDRCGSPGTSRFLVMPTSWLQLAVVLCAPCSRREAAL